MKIYLDTKSQKLIEQQMKKHGYSTPDEVIRIALEQLDQQEGNFIEDLDSTTQAAIAEGLAQSKRGEGRPWEEVRAELAARFIRH